MREPVQRPGKPARENARANARNARSAHGNRRRSVLLVLALVVVGVAVGAYVVRGQSAASEAGVRPLATLSTTDFHALAFSPDNPDTAFFGHHNGIMRTEDGGRSWRSLVDRRNFDAMSLAAGSGARFYLAGHDIFQVSGDGGASWQPLLHNLPGTDVHGFAMSPTDANRLYAFVVGHGGFRSSDGVPRGSVWGAVSLTTSWR